MHPHRNGPEQEVDTQPVTIFDCANCDRSFPTKIGLGQHRRHAHPVERNHEKLISLKTAGSNWSQQESASLIRSADALAPLCPTRRELHHRLLSHFPGRTFKSIRTRLYALNWQRNTVPAANPTTFSQINATSDIESQATDHSEWFTCLIQTVITQLESNSEAFLHSGELLAIAKVRNSRGGRSDHSVICRGNCGQPESLIHILQSCWVSHDVRCARHNRVAKDLAERLRKLGYTVFDELRVPTASSFIKPDVIVVRDGAAVVLDVSIVDDYRSQLAWTDKVVK